MTIWTPPPAFPDDFSADSASAATLLEALRKASVCLEAADVSNEDRLRALLVQPKSSLARTHAMALVAGLIRGMAKRPEFHAQGTLEQSFDEHWVLRLVERASQNDGASVSFLLTRRIALPARETVARLLAALVAQLALDDQIRTAARVH